MCEIKTTCYAGGAIKIVIAKESPFPDIRVVQAIIIKRKGRVINKWLRKNL